MSSALSIKKIKNLNGQTKFNYSLFFLENLLNSRRNYDMVVFIVLQNIGLIIVFLILKLPYGLSKVALG
jgi:hypothetical protein